MYLKKQTFFFKCGPWRTPSPHFSEGIDTCVHQKRLNFSSEGVGFAIFERLFPTKPHEGLGLVTQKELNPQTWVSVTFHWKCRLNSQIRLIQMRQIVGCEFEKRNVTHSSRISISKTVHGRHLVGGSSH